MTWRLIGLMSAVLFLSLGAFFVLLSLSEDDIMDEVTRTVSAVGTKTLSAFVDLHGAPAWSPKEDGAAATRRIITRHFTEGEGFEAVSEEERIQRWISEGLASPPPPGNGLFVIRIAGGPPREVADEEGAGPGPGFASYGSVYLSGAEVQVESEREEVRARIPIFRSVDAEMVTIDLQSDDPDPDGAGAQEPAVQGPRTIRDELVFRVPTRDYQSIFDRIRKRSLLLLMGVFMVGMVLSAGLARRFTRPIRELDRGLRLLTTGDLDVSVKVSGQEEVSRLGHAFNDMTRRLRFSRERAKEVTRSEKLSALGRLAAGVAHDVRNPLHSIGLTLQHLQDTCRPESDDPRAEFDRSMALIRGEIRRLDELVGNFLTFARSDRQERRSVRPQDLLQETARLVQKEAERRGITVEIGGEDDASLIEVHAESVRSALLNLVLNSFEAMPQGGVVSLSCSSGKGEDNGPAVRIEVRDTGCGISEEDREQVFEFGYTSREAGHGLGLAMVHQIVVEEHGGRVSLESEPGKGTRICLEFPEGGAES
ncbi:MAG: ATP-binding protein [Planctomycetota bacterium]